MPIIKKIRKEKKLTVIEFFYNPTKPMASI